jgi:acid phosphatase (class A)
MKLPASILMSVLCNVISRETILALPCLILMASCTCLVKQSSIEPMPERLGSGGYLPMEALPNSLAILPPPPVEGTAAFALDNEISQKSISLRDSPRWELAKEDNNMWFPAPVNAFSCSLNVPITEQNTPHLYKLLLRTFDDVGFSDISIKYKYIRTRPYVLNKEPRCTRVSMKKHHSYPSGSAALGWAYALILSEISPKQTDALIARGRAYGQSEVICNVNWQSAVNEGRTLATAVVARLHAEPDFRAAVEAAKSELVAVRAKGLIPERDCEAEAAALSLSPASTS